MYMASEICSNLGISVIIPTFNRADLISETLNAVLAQTLPADEIIVVDDGSTDGTSAILAGFASRVRHIPIPNSGDLVARNVGLQAARGRLVAFCDSDDIWLPEFLDAVSASWRAEPGLRACYSDFRILRDGVLASRSKLDDAPAAFWDGWRETGPDTGVFDSSCARNLLAFQPFFPSCMMVDREAFHSIGGWDEAVSRIIGGDFATALRVAASPPVGLVRRTLVGIRKHGGNISANTERMNLGDAQVLEHVLQTRPDLALLEDAIRRIMARRRSDALDSAFSRRDFAAVRDIYTLLPASARAPRLRAKHAVANVPFPLGKLAAWLVSR